MMWIFFGALEVGKAVAAVRAQLRFSCACSIAQNDGRLDLFAPDVVRYTERDHFSDGWMQGLVDLTRGDFRRPG